MRAQRPEYCGDVLDRVCLDRHAAHDDDAPALLDLVEDPLEVTIERRWRQWSAKIRPNGRPAWRTLSSTSSSAETCLEVRSKAMSSFEKSRPCQAIGWSMRVL
jgi:hypothetical protein